jgi:ABC-type multidrug transport system fused ATPase/permease subunit
MKESIVNLLKIPNFFRKRYTRLVIILIEGLVLMSTLESVGRSLFLSLFELIGTIESPGTNPIRQLVGGLFTLFHVLLVLGSIVTFIVVMMMTKGIVRWLTMRHNAITTAQLGVDMRFELFDALLRANWD